MNEPYPIRFSVDYPDRPLNRLTTAFRIFTVIPIAIVLFLPVLLMLLFRQKYPRWCVVLFTGRYPPFSLQA